MIENTGSSSSKEVIGYCPRCGSPIYKYPNSDQPVGTCRCASVNKTFSDSFDLKK